MTTIHGRLTQATMAIGALVVSMAVAPPTISRGGPALTVRAVAARGNEIVLTVLNRSTETRTGMVASKALTARGEVGVLTPFTAAAGETVTIRVVLPDRVIDGAPVGVVVDDGVPF
jgi:hypothetical protein